MHSCRVADHDVRETLKSATAPFNISLSGSHGVNCEPHGLQEATAPAMNPPLSQSTWNNDVVSQADMTDPRYFSFETGDMVDTSSQMHTSPYEQSRMAGTFLQWGQNNDAGFQGWPWYQNENDHH